MSKEVLPSGAELKEAPKCHHEDKPTFSVAFFRSKVMQIQPNHKTRSGPIQKRAKDLSRHRSEEVTEMTYWHVKRCPTPVVIRETQSDIGKIPLPNRREGSNEKII